MIRYLPILFLCLNVSAQVQPNRNGYVHPKITVQSGTNLTNVNITFYKGNDTFVITQNTGSWLLNQDSGLSWDQPLVFINASNKKIVVNGGVAAENCQYVKIIGFGSDSAYGFEFRNGGTTGNFQGMMKGIMIEGCRFTGGSAGGVWIKEEAPHACDFLNYYTNVDTDPAHAKYRDPYQYLAVGNKPFDSIYFRHNMVDSCGGEAVYLMSTGAFGRDNVPCLPNLPNGTKQYAPTQGKNCHFDSNYFTYAGRTAIQANLLTGGTNTVNDNIIYNVGYEWAVTHSSAALDQGGGVRIGWATRNVEVARNRIVKTWLYNIDAGEAGNYHDNYCDSVAFVTYNNALVQRPSTSPIAGITAYANNAAVTPMIIRSNTVKYATASAGIRIAIYGGNKFLSSGNDTCFNIGKVALLSTPFNANPTCSGTGTDTTCHDSTYTKYYDSTVTATVTRTIFYDSTIFKNDTSYWRPLKLDGATRIMIRINKGTYVTYHLSRDTTYDTTFLCTGCASKDTTVQVCIITGGSSMNKIEMNELNSYAWNYKPELIKSYGKER